MDTCNHPKLIEVDSFTASVVAIAGQSGNVDGMFMWKKYRCDQCHKLITILQAVVEK